jgi:hypothetical protein
MGHSSVECESNVVSMTNKIRDHKKQNMPDVFVPVDKWHNMQYDYWMEHQLLMMMMLMIEIGDCHQLWLDHFDDRQENENDQSKFGYNFESLHQRILPVHVK